MAQGRSIGGVVRGLLVADCPGSRLGGPVVCDPGSHACVGVSRLSSNAAELNALMLAVRGVSVALQLDESGVPWLDTSFVSDNKYALGIMQFETSAVANHAQAQMARQWSWAAKNQFAAKFLHVCPHWSYGQ